MNLQNTTLNFTIICEYNPFHRGHLLQIETIKREFPQSTVTAVMSGSFVQRGDVATFDKYKRAEVAVKCGADLVLELPFPWSMASGEFFASAGVSLIDRLKIFDRLCFGSESGDVGQLTQTAANTLDARFEQSLAAEASKSTSESYIRMRSRIYREMFGHDLASTPNDILGIEYIRALKKRESHITPHVIKREVGYSATESRRSLRSGDTDRLAELVPPEMLDVTSGVEVSDIEHMASAMIYRLRTSTPDEVERFAEIPVGMGRRLISAAARASTFAELCENAKSKLHTDARIRRMVIFYMLGVTADDLHSLPEYTTVLAVGGRGRELLSKIRAARKNAPDMPQVITKPSSAPTSRQLELARICETFYGMCYAKKLDVGEDLRKSPFVFDETRGKKNG